MEGEESRKSWIIDPICASHSDYDSAPHVGNCTDKVSDDGSASVPYLAPRKNIPQESPPYINE